MTISMLDNQFQNIDSNALETATGGKSLLHRIAGGIKKGAGKVAGAAHTIVEDASLGTTVGGGIGSVGGPEGAALGAVAGLGFGTGYGIGEAIAQ